MDSPTKACSSCKNIKPFSAFSKSNASKDGLRSWCKQCSQEAHKRSRHQNKERSQDVIAASIPCIKLCRKCNTKKTQSDFPHNSSKRDGLGSYCSECNRLFLASYYATYYEANKTRVLIATKKWQKENPEQCAAINSKRRALKKSAHGSHTGDDVKKLMLLQRGKCAACKKDIRAKYNVDHITALARGGSDNKDNLQLLCQRCNNQKHVKHPIDFMREKGYLL